MEKTAIIYYSWTGTTDIVARQINEMTSYPMERIIETKGHKRNMVNAAMGAFFGMKSQLDPIKTNLDFYDNIILGTPVWTAKLPPAINSFLKKTRLKNKNIWIFMSKSIDEDPIKTIRSLKKYIDHKGGKLVDILYTKSFWSPEKQILPKVEDIKDSISDWLIKNQLL